MLIFYPLMLTARNFTVSGYVRVAGSGESVINCSVFETKKLQGTSTNNFGFYSLTLNEGSIALRFSCVGFRTENIPIKLNKDTVINILLAESIELNELTVLAERKETGIRGSQLSTVDVPVKMIRSVPALLGETDVLKTLQMLPGVQGGTEGSSGFYTRGGGPDENLFLLDGIPVYNANHMAGFFSVFNADAVKSVTLYKGGFPARFGGRLSSVVDVRMNDGNNQKLSGSVSAGLISSRINIEGPLFSKKTTFHLAARRSYLDLLTRPLFNMIENNVDIKAEAGYYFYDVNLKIVHRFSDRDQIFFTNYFGDDVIDAQVLDQYDVTDNGYKQGNILIDWKWGNVISSLRWNHLFGNKLFMNATVSFTNYRFDMMMGNRDVTVVNQPFEEKISGASLGYFSGISDMSYKADFDYTPASNHDVKFGLSAIQHVFKPGITVDLDGYDTDALIKDTVYGNANIPSLETGVYVEDNIQFNDWVKANIGLHYAAFRVRDVWFHDIQPRLSMRVLLNDDISFKAGFASMSQYMHLLSYNNFTLPNDLWVPATDVTAPMKSVQYSAGFFYQWKKTLDFSIEGYYKSMDNVIEYMDGATFFGSSGDWEKKIVAGKGKSYGLELLVQKNFGKTTGWIGYTWSRTLRQFNRQGQLINNGEIFQAKYDRPHDLSVLLTHRLNEKIEFSGSVKYTSGNMVTLPMQDYRGFSEFDSKIPYFTRRNNYRLPDYFRVDAGVNLHKQLKKGKQTWMIGIYNLTNQMNPFYVFVATNKKPDPVTGELVSVRSLNKITIFPIIPSVSYVYKF
jgi:outer membrane cobalamin receptor